MITELTYCFKFTVKSSNIATLKGSKKRTEAKWNGKRHLLFPAGCEGVCRHYSKYLPAAPHFH